MVLNFQSHNASYFCPLCIATSKVEIVDNVRHNYIPLSKMFDSERRTHSGFLALAYSSILTNLPDYGVKGQCYLSNINSFDFIRSTVIDYMHSLCLGIIKKTIDLIKRDNRYRQLLILLKD